LLTKRGQMDAVRDQRGKNIEGGGKLREKRKKNLAPAQAPGGKKRIRFAKDNRKGTKHRQKGPQMGRSGEKKGYPGEKKKYVYWGRGKKRGKRTSLRVEEPGKHPKKASGRKANEKSKGANHQQCKGRKKTRPDRIEYRTEEC